MSNLVITPDTLLMDLFQEEKIDAIAEVLFGIGMHCLGCPAARGETIGEAAAEHGIPVEELIAKLNEAINS